jgi:RNase P subunit RPR2
MSERISQKAVTVERVTINALDCPNCGVVFGITDEYEQRHRESGAYFYCPNQHYMSYGESRLQNAERARDAAAGRAEQLALDNERLVNDLLDAAKEAQRLKRRAKAGVCSECHRTFQNVARHMATKHTGKP